MCRDLTDANFIEFSRKTIGLYYQLSDRQKMQDVPPPQTSTLSEGDQGPGAPPSSPTTTTPVTPCTLEAQWPSSDPPPQSQSTSVHLAHLGKDTQHGALHSQHFMDVGLGREIQFSRQQLHLHLLMLLD